MVCFGDRDSRVMTAGYDRVGSEAVAVPVAVRYYFAQFGCNELWQKLGELGIALDSPTACQERDRVPFEMIFLYPSVVIPEVVTFVI